MKILVVGNLGYVGTLLPGVFAAIERGVSFVGLDPAWFSDDETPSKLLNVAKPHFQILGDIRSLMVQNFIRLSDFSVVIYLAAVSNDAGGETFAEATCEINFCAAKHLSQMCSDAGVKKFIFASSCSLYGRGDGNRLLSESDKLEPLTTYARSKADFENWAESYDWKQTTCLCLRFATACGVSPRTRFDLVLNDFAFSAWQHGAIELTSTGNSSRPLISVEDMANIIMEFSLLEMPSGYLAVNVGSEQNNVKISELAELTADFFQCPITYARGAIVDERSYAVDFSKLSSLLPHYTCESLSTVLNKFKLFLEEWDAAKNRPKFRRLERLNRLVERKMLSKNLMVTRDEM